MKNLSLKEKIGQLFIIGFRGSNISDNAEITEIISTHKPGGVIFFDKDMVHDEPVHNIQTPAQVKKLVTDLQSFADIPLFVGVDQEGGQVSRLKPEHGFPEVISAQRLGAIDNPDVTFNEGLLVAKMLSDCGINLNFAPVVDLAINPDSPAIAKKERSYGDSPKKVIRHAEQFIKAHQSANILTCCKHFPGHGSAEGDTHAGFVDVTKTWDKNELKPYSYLISNNLCPIIMSAHIFHAELDKDFPSTLSRKVLTNLLRDKLNYDGLIISDDMQMLAISDHYSLEESLKLGLQAGIDIFCYGNNLLKNQIDLGEAIEVILNLVSKGEISEQRIDESINRISRLKNSYLSVSV